MPRKSREEIRKSRWQDYLARCERERIKRLEHSRHNREELAARHRHYRAENRGWILERARESRKHAREMLEDSYIRQRLGNFRASKDLIEAKRTQLKLRRMLRA